MSLPEITPEIARAVLTTLEAMGPDAVNKPALLAYLGGPGPHCELRTMLRSLARQRQPKTYLEIGVRLGWSLVQVASEAPYCDITACDSWVPGYGGVANSGPAHVLRELETVAPEFHGSLALLSDSSRACIPFLPADMRFDLVCVDGDHTAAGAFTDLQMCLPLVAMGGALVFDDLVDWADDDGSLLWMWRAVQREHPGFVWHEVPGLVPVGVAERVTA